MKATPFLLRGSCPQYIHIPVHFTLLIPKVLMLTLSVSYWSLPVCLDHGPNIPGSLQQYCSLQHHFISITSHIHNWMLFLLRLHLFILSGVSCPLISNSILGTYQPGEFIFQCPIFLPFLTVHGVLKVRILKWFAIPFSSGPNSVRPLHHDPSSLGAPHGMA